MHVPLFPLPRCVMLPGALVPLHIFEWRYRDMMAHVLDRPPSERFVALAMLGEGYEPVYETLAAPIHPIACVGQLVEHERLADGRFNLVLRGRWRVLVLDEDRSRTFRLARVKVLVSEWGSFASDAPGQLEVLQELLRNLTGVGAAEPAMVQWLVRSSPCPESFVDAVTYYLLPPPEAELKQTILAEPDIGARVALLLEGLRRMLTRADERLPQPDWPPAPSEN